LIFKLSFAPLFCVPLATVIKLPFPASKTNQAAAMGEQASRFALPLLLFVLCAISLQQAAAAAGQDPWQVCSKINDEAAASWQLA
jgi:hypothetical protein